MCARLAGCNLMWMITFPMMCVGNVGLHTGFSVIVINTFGFAYPFLLALMCGLISASGFHTLLYMTSVILNRVETKRAWMWIMLFYLYIQLYGIAYAINVGLLFGFGVSSALQFSIVATFMSAPVYGTGILSLYEYLRKLAQDAKTTSTSWRRASLK